MYLYWRLYEDTAAILTAKRWSCVRVPQDIVPMPTYFCHCLPSPESQKLSMISHFQIELSAPLQGILAFCCCFATRCYKQAYSYVRMRKY